MWWEIVPPGIYLESRFHRKSRSSIWLHWGCAQQPAPTPALWVCVWSRTAVVLKAYCELVELLGVFHGEQIHYLLINPPERTQKRRSREERGRREKLQRRRSDRGEEEGGLGGGKNRDREKCRRFDWKGKKTCGIDSCCCGSRSCRGWAGRGLRWRGGYGCSSRSLQLWM